MKEFVVKLVCKFEDDLQQKMLIEFLKTKFKEFEQFGSTCKGILVERHDHQGLFVPNNRENTVIIDGNDCIEEQLLENTFVVPINSFFQVHTDLAELLYSKVNISNREVFKSQIGEILKVDSNTVVLDICAGAGTIGLSVCKQAKKIIFIECEPSACEVINVNARKNDYITENENGMIGSQINQRK